MMAASRKLIGTPAIGRLLIGSVRPGTDGLLSGADCGIAADRPLTPNTVI
jgi:hypothetical protein